MTGFQALAMEQGRLLQVDVGFGDESRPVWG